MLHACVPQRVGCRSIVCRPCRKGGQKQQQRGQGTGRGRSLVFPAHRCVYFGYYFYGILIIGRHGLDTGIGRIPCIFAGVQQRYVLRYRALRHPGSCQARGDVVLAEFRGIKVELVGDIAEQGPVEFLVECRIQVLLQEHARFGKALAGHFGGLPCLEPRHVGTAPAQAAYRGIRTGGKHEEQHRHEPESTGADEERARSGHGRNRHRNIPYVAAEILDIPAVDSGNGSGTSRGSGRL